MRTRIGMLVRAGASNREMIGALGINIKLLYTFVFGIGAALAGLAGMMQTPILTASIGMGENILILAFVVIIIGGIGSIRGAFVASIFVGLIDTVGRAFLPDAAEAVPDARGGLDGGPGSVVDADLSLDGDHSDRAARRPVSGRGQSMTVLLHRAQHRRRGVARHARAGAALRGHGSKQQLHDEPVHAHRHPRDRGVSLNLIMGYGGMVSFGHAAYLGIGGYAVGILAYEGVTVRLRAMAAGADRLRRCSRSSSARCRCARAASISS